MLLSQIKDYKYIIGLVIAYCLVSYCMVATYGPDITPEHKAGSLVHEIMRFIQNFAVLMTFIMITLILRIMIIERPKRLFKKIYSDFRTIWLSPAFLLRGFIMLACLFIFIFAFSSMKRLIPYIHPYGGLDTVFYELDKTIHFGIDPWRITHTLLPLPIMTFAINFLYNLWFFILYAIFILQAFIHENEQTRKTYFLSFFLCWIINGTFLAVLLSSVGPCYYGLLYGLENGPYAELMARLHEINDIFPLFALDTQDALWAAYSNDHNLLGGGISAMPSLHVSIALLQVFVGYKINRLSGHLLLGFFFVILLGSVHLGWHYAIDGYLSILTTPLIWFFSAWIAKKTTPSIVSKASNP